MGGRRRRETRDSSGEDAARWAAWLVLLPVLLIALPALLLLPTLYFTFVALPVLALCLPVIWRTGAYLGGRLDRFHTADLIAVATVAVVAAVLWAWMVLEAERPDVPQLCGSPSAPAGSSHWWPAGRSCAAPCGGTDLRKRHDGRGHRLLRSARCPSE